MRNRTTTSSTGPGDCDAGEGSTALPFPQHKAAAAPTAPFSARDRPRFLPESADDVLATFDTMSRRINDLARELNCLGYFDDGNDRPRAA